MLFQVDVGATATPGWVVILSRGVFGTADLGAAQSNELLAASSSRIVRRFCADCVASHREVYYRRLTPLPPGFSLYDTLASAWVRAGNVLNVDFELYGSYVDTLARTPSARWAYCNYDDAGSGVGFPYNCAPKRSYVSFQFNSFSGRVRDGQLSVLFQVDVSA